MSTGDDAEQGRARLTSAARKRLGDELELLREQRRELAASLGGGGTTGDRADQADAIERAEELERLDDRITAVADRLARSDETTANVAGDLVEVGTVVTLRFGDGTRETLRVGTIAEGDEEARLVTPDSPLGRALLGHRAGDSVTYVAPSGETSVHVESVRAPNDRLPER